MCFKIHHYHHSLCSRCIRVRIRRIRVPSLHHPSVPTSLPRPRSSSPLSLRHPLHKLPRQLPPHRLPNHLTLPSHPHRTIPDIPQQRKNRVRAHRIRRYRQYSKTYPDEGADESPDPGDGEAEDLEREPEDAEGVEDLSEGWGEGVDLGEGLLEGGWGVGGVGEEGEGDCEEVHCGDWSVLERVWRCGMVFI